MASALCEEYCKKTTCILQHQVVPSLYIPQQVSSIVPSGKESTKGVYYPYILRANIIIQPSIFQIQPFFCYLSHSSFNPQTPNGGAGIYLLRNIAFHTCTDLRLPMSRGERRRIFSYKYSLCVCVFPLSSMVPLINSHQQGEREAKRRRRRKHSQVISFVLQASVVEDPLAVLVHTFTGYPPQFYFFFFFPFLFFG